jgi:F-type H+-transporting ATPase subunit b
MDKILEQLGGLFLGSLPSVFLLIVLYFFLKTILFNPLEKILAERYQKTEGKEKGAADALHQAEKRADEYAKAIQEAKAEIYAQQELLRKSLEAERDAAVATAAQRTDALLNEGRAAIETELADSRVVVEREAVGLARMIAGKVLAKEAA